MAAGDENRLTGYAALPLNLNPYLAQFGERVLAARRRPAARRAPTTSSSTARPPAGAGPFSFRFWIDDTRPPTARLERARLRRGQPSDGQGRGRRLGRRCRDARSSRSTASAASATLSGRSREDRDRRPAAGPACASAPGVRLPGVAQHGERAADPAEHASPERDVRRAPLSEHDRSRPTPALTARRGAERRGRGE